MSLKNALWSIMDNVFSVLRRENARKILSGTMKIEKQAVFGLAAEVGYVLILLVSALILAAAITFLSKL